ncbi:MULTISPECIES: cyclic nucleotide-binding domain-containing protein [unclassified Synechocystis]|uniref:cyclic nucleotide-binding domain-containing protein n=1 Tax=unclassified Synechocystis TaxID=2640012 RepID=UPI00040B2241|nr:MULTISPECIES: Crp/Fnr family transcriptional regulator [unclassified Synechocystis]AIE72987.1 cAMP-binding protein - catabolite gene activator and regulatory subunit of cAMP-dependent protein kinase [Synechocystis sp. PCC 6714]MCT0253513.1 Crp/Fnr family transcriptional regulator [Synechocystis sp. CS-94]
MTSIMMNTVQAYGKTVEKNYKAGEVIFHEGAVELCMFGVLEGEVEMTLQGKFIETIGAGGIFGIGAIVHSDHQRASTAIAKTDCTLVAMDREHFLFVVHETPMFALEVIQNYSDRYRSLKAVYEKAITE